MARFLVMAMSLACAVAPAQPPARSGPAQEPVPPHQAQARRFLAARVPIQGALHPKHALRARAQAAPSAASWEPLGPAAVLTGSFGLVSGRVTALALDPSDATGNTLYVGTTGGGVWLSSNAATANPASIVFRPLTDAPTALATAQDTSISIGALSVQPGGTGVILAGTGDPNDALDSYYGAGLLRSTDRGKTWSLILGTKDVITGLGAMDHGFLGEGFAGFAWSSVNPQLVVAAVSQSWDSSIVQAGAAGYSYSGLYYSNDGGVTWHLSLITDGNGRDVQGPNLVNSGLQGNAATSVVWNPLRRIFIAAVRFHGYYQSADGVTWTRMTSQPGPGLTSALCPNNVTMSGSPACPVFRGALAVNPLTGDTFAWTVDLNNQDQGLWQDVCNLQSGACKGSSVSFSNRLNTTPLEANTLSGAATILNGDYNLVLAAVPSNKDTVLLAGANDVWKCSVGTGCAWRNTTNSTTCMSARVGEYQHALEWNSSNPEEVLAGNDSGLWRSEDGIGERDTVCSSTDADHWQNLNGSLGSLAEVAAMSQVGATPYTLMAGLGANGTAGVKSDTGPTSRWPQILTGEGGPVAIDSAHPDTWYVNNGAGVSIHRCSVQGLCTASDFGEQPVVSNSDVANDGLTMTQPAPFLVDPLDSTQLLVATCRLWRGPVVPGTWTAANAVTPMLGTGASNVYCSGNPLIQTIAAAATPGGGEVVYAGAYGYANGGANLSGHLLKATMDASGVWSGWVDLTLNPISNDSLRFNPENFGVSGIAIDPHDPSGNTFYVTLQGIGSDVRIIYRTTDGGGHWKDIKSNLFYQPLNAIVVDPSDAETVYVAGDAGVYATQRVSLCGDYGVSCWFSLGSGLPRSPVTALSAAPIGTTPSVLVAGTYGRGIWQIPLLTGGAQLTTAGVDPASLSFGEVARGNTSDPLTITFTNKGGIALLPTRVAVSGDDFTESDNCVDASVDTGASCSIQVRFSPTWTGARTGQLTISANLLNGDITVPLSGTGTPPAPVNVQPGSINFGSVAKGQTSDSEQVTVENDNDAAVPVTSLTVTGPFVIVSNACGTTSLAAKSDCAIRLAFSPTEVGPASGALTLIDSAGTQTVQLSGTGTGPAEDTLSPTSLTFPGTIIGATSAAQPVALSNGGGNPLTSVAISINGPFQQTNNCTTQVAAGAYCSIGVTYLASKAGSESGTLTVADIMRTQTILLTGTGLLPPAFTVNPTSLSFAAQPVQVASAPQTLNITNSGGAAMANVGFQITGAGAASFATAANTCGATLAKGSSCTVQVTFKPTANGATQAALTITSSTGQVKSVTVALNGTGHSDSGLTATPAQLNFAATAVGQSSAAQAVTITNSGKVDAAGVALAASGPFALTQNTCGTSLAAGASCTTGVAFSPMQTGNLSGALTITSTNVIAATVSLSGIGGLAGAVNAQPQQVAFPTTGVGSSSSPIPVTLTNLNASVALDNLALTISDHFRIADTTCGTSLAGGASCVANLVFAPTASGASTGNLSIASSAMATAATVPLSGMGFDFTPAASGSNSQTVASGQTAIYSLTITPASGNSGTFTFQCDSLPQYAACVFNPSSLTVAANSVGTEKVSITTSQASAFLARPSSGLPALPAALACGVLLLPFALRRRRGILWLMVAAAVLVCFPGCSSAGGGGGSTPPPANTHNVAAGTYTIPLRISSGGVNHTFNLTLVVD